MLFLQVVLVISPPKGALRVRADLEREPVTRLLMRHICIYKVTFLGSAQHIIFQSDGSQPTKGIRTVRILLHNRIHQRQVAFICIRAVNWK
jgi:hypothetical protein